jgi:glycosyltransferase involved in cell wall biosynthesis
MPRFTANEKQKARAAGPPAVSICIPSYRGAAHIKASIDSVLAQTWTDFELIVVDDDSPDDTLAVAASVDDERITCLRNERRLGAEGNWNRCLREATGRYVKILPQDDLLDPECLARQLALFEADARGELALVFCARRIIDADGRTLFERRPFGPDPRRVDGRAVFRRCLRRGTNVVGEPGGVLFRRDAARAAGEFDATFPYVVDLDYWLRLLEHGEAGYIPETLVSFRVAATQWSVAIGRSQAAQFSGLAAKMAARPSLAPGPLDVLAGRLLARANNVARLLMYRFMFRKRR